MQNLTLQNSMTFVSPILKNQPLMVSGNEPAQTAADMVLGVMLGPPFKWPFNRQATTFPIGPLLGIDYTVVLPDWGFLETQWLADSTGKIYQLTGATTLARESGVARPTKVSLQFDDTADNLTFRVNQTPDQNYTVNLNYQKKMVPLTSSGSYWGQVPDRFGYIFNQGFLAMMSLLVNDARFPIFESFFMSRILGAQDGLTDQERDLFIGNWANVVQTLNRGTSSVTTAAAGRGRA